MGEKRERREKRRTVVVLRDLGRRATEELEEVVGLELRREA